jgi:hypothetical protein
MVPVHGGPGLKGCTDHGSMLLFRPQLEGLFLSSLLLQLLKVNRFFIEKSKELSSHLNRCEQP